MPAPRGPPSSSSVGSRLERAVELPGPLHLADHPAVHRQQRARLGPRGAERVRLVVVVPQHQRGDLVGHLGQQLVPLGPGQLAVGRPPHRAGS